jgi:hypothetical protein
MNLVEMFRNFIGKARHSETTEMRSIVIMQRQQHQFTEEELQAAGERGWGRKFDGKDDPMYFVSANHAALTVVKAGPHIIRVTSLPTRYADDDEYALSQLPQPEQKEAWTEHRACALLDLFNDLSHQREENPRFRGLCFTCQTSSAAWRSELHRHLCANQKHDVSE